MKDIEETDRVNRVMAEILKTTSGKLSVEGYSVISDSNQNPHTFVEIYIDRIDLNGYMSVIQLFSKEFIGYSVNDFLIPESPHRAHERFMLILHINKKEDL